MTFAVKQAIHMKSLLAGDLSHAISNGNQVNYFLGIDFAWLSNQIVLEAAFQRELMSSRKTLVYEISESGQPRLTRLGHAFYELFYHEIGISNNHYELSEHFRVRLQLANRCGLYRVLLQIPEVVVADRVAICNDFIHRLRNDLSLKTNKDAIRKRKGTLKLWVNGIKRSIATNLTDHQAIVIHRVDLSSSTMSSHSLEQSGRIWAQMLQIIDTNPDLSTLLSYAWRREYVAEQGFRYHLILILDGFDQQRLPSTISLIARMWEKISGSHDAIVVNSCGYRAHGCGLVTSDNFQMAIQSLLESLKSTQRLEESYRLPDAPHHQHTGAKGDSTKFSMPSIGPNKVHFENHKRPIAQTGQLF